MDFKAIVAAHEAATHWFQPTLRLNSKASFREFLCENPMEQWTEVPHSGVRKVSCRVYRDALGRALVLPDYDDVKRGNPADLWDNWEEFEHNFSFKFLEAPRRRPLVDALESVEFPLEADDLSEAKEFLSFVCHPETPPEKESLKCECLDRWIMETKRKSNGAALIAHPRILRSILLLFAEFAAAHIGREELKFSKDGRDADNAEAQNASAYEDTLPKLYLASHPEENWLIEVSNILINPDATIRTRPLGTCLKIMAKHAKAAR